MKIKANKILAVLCVIAMLMTMIVPMTLTATAAEQTYSYTFTKTQFSANGTKTLDGVTWTLAGDGGYWGKDGTKGQQFGSGSKPYKYLTLTSDNFEGVTKIVINTSGASSINASLVVTVGGITVGSSTKLTSSATNYTFECEQPLSGPVVLKYTQTSSKAIYIKSITIDYGAVAGEPTCEHTNTTTTTVDATCTEDGSTTVTCDDCGEDVSTEVIEATGHSYVEGVCSKCGEKQPEISAPDPTKYTFSNYTAGTQYADNEEHKLDDYLTVITTDCHFTSELRIYSSSTYNGFAILKATDGLNISGLVVNAGNKVDTLNVYGSSDGGNTWALIQGVSVTSTSYNDYTVNFNGAAFSQIKLDVKGTNQVRIKNMTVTYAAAVVVDPTCQHPNTEQHPAVEPTCTEVGYTAGVYCPDCEAYIEGHEQIAINHKNTSTTTVEATCYKTGSITVTCDDCGATVSTTTIPVIVHSYVNGVCSGCNTVSEIEVGVPYRFVVHQNNLSKDLYPTGAMSGYYFATTETAADSIVVFFETAEDGYYMYHLVDGAKKYISIVADNGHINVKYVDADPAVFTWNSTYNTPTTIIEGTEYYLGTYGTYSTLSASKISFAATSFVGQLVKLGNVAQMSVNAGADLSLLAHIALATGENATDYSVIFTHIASGETFTVEIVGGKAILDNIPPQAMGDLFKVELVKGEDVVDTVEEYSIKEYAETILAGDYDAATKAFVKAMLVYGAEAQKHTGYNENALVTEATPDVLPNDINVVTGTDKDTNLVGFKVLGVKFDNAIQLYIKLDNADVKVNGITPVACEGGYIVYTDKILATQFGETFTFDVTDADGNPIQKFTYSVNSFAASAKTDLAKALYHYGAAAAALNA